MTAATRWPWRESPTDGRPTEFQHRALCQSIDPELFFPTAERGPEMDRQVAAAKAVCAACPVLVECREWALAGLAEGIAGGLTAEERRTERGRRGRTGSPVRRPPRCGSQLEVAAAGRAAIRSGWSVRVVAREFGVTERTAGRWAAQARTSTPATRGAGEGALAATGAPSGFSHNTALAGIRAAEGHRG